MFDLIPFGRRNRELAHYFDDFEKDFFGGFEHGLAGFKTDILDKGNRYELQAELPGFSKEDIHIDIDGDYLTVSAEHTAENEDRKNNYIRKERHYGVYSRSFNIADVKADEISAQYRHGVLKLEMPKRNSEERKSHRIDID